MKLCTYRSPIGPRLGRIEGDRVEPLYGRSVADALVAVPPGRGAAVALEPERLLAPLRPGALYGVGLNHPAHAAEIGAPLPAEPKIFVKLRGAVTAPHGPVELPHHSDQVDYEGELAVVIGRRAHRVPERRALEHVFGYTIIDDISARDRQREEPQWVRAKGCPTFAPLGPWVVTADEIPDPQRLRIRTWVNDELRQDGSTADMVFSVAHLISWCSHSFVLEPGDVIATGTPAGVGLGRTPPRFLAAGDRVRIAIDGVGEICHPIIDREDTP